MRGWERLLVGLFGLLFVAVDTGTLVLDVLVRSVGWFVVLAALGVVELAMAIYYRSRRYIRARG